MSDKYGQYLYEEHAPEGYPKTPTNPPAKHPPRYWADKQGFCAVDGKSGFAGWVRLSNGFISPELPDQCIYLSLQEHTALLQEERARAYSHAKEMVAAFKEELASGKSVSSCLNQLEDYFRVMAE